MLFLQHEKTHPWKWHLPVTFYDSSAYCTISRVRKAHSFHIMIFEDLQWPFILPFGEIQRTTALKELRAIRCHFSSLGLGGVRTCCVEQLEFALIYPESRSHFLKENILQSYKLLWGMRNCLLKGSCKMIRSWLWGLRIYPLIMCEIQSELIAYVLL